MKGLPIKETIVNGKKRIIIERSASGEDKVKDAILRVMGDEYEFKDKEVS